MNEPPRLPHAQPARNYHPKYRDGDHLSVHGSRLVGGELARLLAAGH